MKRILAVLTGARGAGKDSVAGCLVEHHSFTQLAFADNIRTEAARAWGVPVGVFTDPKSKEVCTPWLRLHRCKDGGFRDWVSREQGRHKTEESRTRSPRWVLQQWGDYRIATQGADYWIKLLLADVRRACLRSSRHIVVSDARSQREIEALLETGLRVEVVHVVGSYPEFVKQSAEHHRTDWEPEPTRFYTINNSDCLCSLRARVTSWFKAIVF